MNDGQKRIDSDNQVERLVILPCPFCGGKADLMMPTEMIYDFPVDGDELKGNRKGQLAVKLDQGYRLIFEPANEPVPKKEDGGLDWSQVTAIKVVKLSEDYHE